MLRARPPFWTGAAVGVLAIASLFLTPSGFYFDQLWLGFSKADPLTLWFFLSWSSFSPGPKRWPPFISGSPKGRMDPHWAFGARGPRPSAPGRDYLRELTQHRDKQRGAPNMALGGGSSWGHGGFWAMLPLARVPFWVPVFEPQPFDHP